MRIRDLFHPYLGFSNPVADRGSVRTAAGICLDVRSGHLLVVEPALPDGTGAGVYALEGDGRPAHRVRLELPEAFRPHGIATRAGGLWISDEASDSILAVDGDGRGVGSLRASDFGIRRPGALAGRSDGALFVADRAGNRVVGVDAKGRRQCGFSLTPFPEARLCGVSADEETGWLWLAFRPEVAERDGRVGESGVFEVSTEGRVLRRWETAALGFCALDLAVSERLLFAVTRPFVLPRTAGDHAHVVILDLVSGESSGRPNPQLARRFLWENNLFGGGFERNAHFTRRWATGRVPVQVAPQVDMRRDDVRAAFEAWARASRGALAFEFVERLIGSGIRVIDGDTAHVEGRPSEGGVVELCVCNRTHLGAHPRGAEPRAVRRSIARHEVGHAIGFYGHSPRFRVDTMNSISGYSEDLSPEEALFAEVLYACPPSSSARVVERALENALRGR